MRTALVTLTAICAAASRLAAQQQPPADAADPCADASAQAALTACAGLAYRQADSALASAYRSALAASRSGARRSALRSAQQAWLGYREAHCRYVAAAFAGGTAQPMERSLCLAALTRTRARQLRQVAAGGRGAGEELPLVVGPGLGGRVGGSAAAQVTGTVTYRERIALPAGAVLTVRLEEVSQQNESRQDEPQQDVSAIVVAEQTMAISGRQVPIPFTLAFERGAVRESGRYVVRAAIYAGGDPSSGGALLFATTRDYPVLTRGAPRAVAIVLERVRAAPNSGASAVVVDPWEDARGRGVSFRAVGNEPGWMIEIVDGQQVTMLADYGQRRVVTPAPSPSTDPSTGARVYRIRTDANRLDVRIEARGCQDAMSGRQFPSTVTASLDGRTYRGCGRWLR